MYFKMEKNSKGRYKKREIESGHYVVGSYTADQIHKLINKGMNKTVNLRLYSALPLLTKQKPQGQCIAEAVTCKHDQVS